MNSIKLLITAICIIATFGVSMTVIKADDTVLNVIEPSETELTLNKAENNSNIETTRKNDAKTPTTTRKKSNSETQKAEETIEEEANITPIEVFYENEETTEIVSGESEAIYDYKDKFNNQLIIGDSLVSDLINYNMIDDNNISSIDGALSVKICSPFYDKIANDKPEKIFILIGKDNLFSSTTITIANTLHQANPSSIVYLVGVPNARKSTTVDKYNKNLKEKAEKAGYSFIMPDDVSSDMIADDGKTLNEYGFSLLLDKMN